MTAEIISVGTELLLGNILNTNAQYLSRELAALGITVRRQSTIGDNHSRLAEFVNEAKQRCDLLVFTGGLGPTADDLTKETVAACFGDTLTFDPDEWQKIVDFFTRTGRKTTPNNRKQAMVPVHGHKVVNHHGTAPGAWFEQDGHCAVLMPGVPHEMKAMWEESVRPLLLARQSCALHSLTLRVLGGESDYRDVLELLRWLNGQADPALDQSERWYVAMRLFYPEFAALPQPLWPDATQFLTEFLAAGRREQPRPGPALMDWQQDAPLIAAGISRAAGQDVRTLPYLHWWSFLAWFDAIGEGSFATVVAIRDKLRRGKRLENWELDFYRTHRAAVELRSPASPAQEAEKQRLLALLQ